CARTYGRDWYFDVW
nr:immunoglobulin heavy chain junction region [Mus musculus]NSM04958.1 immunoglobulin heavy chain junction region [Mus musculus]NSM05052.1 immunoglobulin heavy chain junction region [Mus musculus]NSM06946.1 immunoglobulin heavy chain junction region [Mus musculus]NSM06989.1 immunoglobulin heavy chain junction region [Mus musculus]